MHANGPTSASDEASRPTPLRKYPKLIKPAICCRDIGCAGCFLAYADIANRTKRYYSFATFSSYCLRVGFMHCPASLRRRSIHSGRHCRAAGSCTKATDEQWEGA